MMLWQKESNKSNAMYVDIFELNGGQEKLKHMMGNFPTNVPATVKKDEISLQKRKEGNVHFGRGNWDGALTSYNESICYAEVGSKNLSLGYANRSACFVKMRRLDECLVDIELAKETGYPSNLMPKLEQRLADCLKQIEDGKSLSDKLRTKLDFEPNERFPCMANVLDLDLGANRNFSIVVKEDIDIGKTIVVEKAFNAYLYEFKAQKCNICLKGFTNLMPCETCLSAMFCSDECQQNSLHGYECGHKQ